VEHHGQPALDEQPRPVSPGSDPRRLYLVIAVMACVIALLLISNWVSDGRATDPNASVVPATAGATPAVVSGSASAAPVPSEAGPADPYADLWVTCGSPSGWRAATIQHWAGRTGPIRSWIAIEPVEAAGPLDPAIPFAPVFTDAVTALGYCAPLDDRERPPESAVASLWALHADGARRLPLVPLEPATANALGGLWLPAVGSTGDGGSWLPGRYVIEVASPSGSFHRWLGLEIEDIARLRGASPSPGPSASPGPSSSPGPSASPA
jgi:hypothetical protein